MTLTDKYTCSQHDTTGHFTCTPILSGRAAPRGAQSPEDGDNAARKEHSHQQAVARARRRVDEMVHDFNLGLMWTLSYEIAPPDYRTVTTTLTLFARRMRDSGLVMPRLTVPEQDENGRWHLHLAVPVFVPHTVLAQVWANGVIGVPNYQKATGESGLTAISRYLTKGFDRTPAGRRRYVASPGMRPVVKRFTAPDVESALAIASERAGTSPEYLGWHHGTLVAKYPVSHKWTAA